MSKSEMDVHGLGRRSLSVSGSMAAPWGGVGCSGKSLPHFQQVLEVEIILHYFLIFIFCDPAAPFAEVQAVCAGQVPQQS